MKILIIDDSKPMRHLVRRTLIKAGFTEHEFKEASDGQEALEAIRESVPDLVLADWNMPRMSGIELLKALNQEEIKVKFGFITSEQTAEMSEQANEHGALFLIGKPFSADIFRETLSEHIQ